MKKATDYKLTFYGVDGEQYFTGHGLFGSTFEDTATGIGDSNFEALNDALDSLAQNGWDVEALEQMILRRSLDGKKLLDKPEDLGDEMHYYVSVDVKGEGS